MSGTYRVAITVILLAGTLAISQTTLLAQTGQNPAGQQPAPATKDQKPADSGSTLEIPTAQPPVNAEEDAAAKAFESLPNTDVPKKIAAGEDFLKKYPDSRYRPVIYSTLTMAYIQDGKPEKAFEIGDKEITLKPDDVQTLALLSQTIPRAMNANTPEPTKQLAKAETYAKRAIDVTPTIPKPDGMPDQNFIAAKNATLCMAHSGLGLVYFRRAQYKEAIPELEQSVKIDPNPVPDPVNLYLLGKSNEKASHYEDAVAAYNKCAAIAGGLQATCKSGADEAKKQGATQLSSPK